MTKLLSSVSLAIVVATASLAGCQLYFGDHRSDDAPNNPGTPGRPPGFECNGDAQCAAGCFCDDGVCAEAGFCRTDKECGSGFICDVPRASCKPAPACTVDTQCTAGSVCDVGSGACVVTCTCASDAEAIEKGTGWCDETRGTCMTGADPAGACLGIITCTSSVPDCKEGEVPLRKDGCFTGQCRAITACEGAPTCLALQFLNDCHTRTDCEPSYVAKCTGTCPGADCKCGDFEFSACWDLGQAPAPTTTFH